MELRRPWVFVKARDILERAEFRNSFNSTLIDQHRQCSITNLDYKLERSFAQHDCVQTLFCDQFTSMLRQRMTGCTPRQHEFHNRRTPIRCRNMAETAQNLHSTSPTTFHHGITYTSYQGNTFALKFNTSGTRILVDPWLVGDLTFMEQTWLYRGLKNDTSQVVNVKQILEETDLIILTQSLDDHTHMPTLKLLPRNIPIIANPDAAARIAPLGFTNVLTIEHGQTRVACDGRVKITATAGALVGPPWSKRQSGIVFQETTPGAVSVYYEPHCDFEDSSVRSISPVDVVISPVKSVIMQIGPIPYPLVQGDLNLMKLMKMLKPKVLIPLLNTETKQEGPLALLLSERGDYKRVAEELREAGLSTRVEFPAPSGEALAIAL